jgi:hypothetical protein
MRNFILLSALAACALIFGACASSEQQKLSNAGAEAMPTATVRTSSPIATAPTNTNAPPTATAHGAPPPLPESSAPQSGAQSGGQSSGADTTAFDKKVEQAEAKAKAPKATQADKQAAAAAYLIRGNFFYNAGNPSLYKFALRDFRRALRYDANNEEARAKQQQIEEIYKSMGRPVPELGNEP